MDPGAQKTGFPDRGPTVFAVTTATLAVTTLFVAARLVSRVGIMRRAGSDDYSLVLAWLIAVFLSLSVCLGAKRGLGRHDSDIDPENQAGLFMCEYVFSVLYNPALMATKTSILIFYLKLSRNTQKVLRLTSWAVLAIVNVAGAVLTFLNIFQCYPIRAAWDIAVEADRCLPLLVEFICSAPVNITTDLAILLLPIPVLTSMRLPPRQKAILVATFALGIFATVVDVVRIYYVQKAIDHVPKASLSFQPIAPYALNPEFSWNASFALMWSAVEVNVGIICACIPTLKPLVIRILPAILAEPNRKSGTHTTTAAGTTATTSTMTTATTSSTTTETMLVTLSPSTTLAYPNAAVLSTATTAFPFHEHAISIHDFPPTHTTTTTTTAVHSRPTSHHKGTYFGFISLPNPKSMLRTTPRESLRYCATTGVLFLLVGFDYGLLYSLHYALASVARLSVPEVLGLTAVGLGGGSVVGGAVGGWVLSRGSSDDDDHHRRRRGRRSGKRKQGEDGVVGGFKVAFITGLLIYGIGTIMFWPAAVVGTYGGFVVSSFVAGVGLAVLETAASPFVVLCGPAGYADARLLLARGVQAVGSVVSGVLADRVFFVGVELGEGDTSALIAVQWTYLALMLLSVLLAMFFYYIPLPEVGDAELAAQATHLPVDPKKKSIGGISLRAWTISLAVLAQWFYLSAQQTTTLLFHPILTSFTTTTTTLTPAQYLLLAYTALAISRLLSGTTLYLLPTHHGDHNSFRITPLTLLTLSITLSTLLSLTIVILPATTNPSLATIPLILFFFTAAPIPPLLTSLGLKGQGERTKRAAGWMGMSGWGVAAWPFVVYGIVRNGEGVRVGFVVVVVLVASAGVFPCFCWGMKGARRVVCGRIELGVVVRRVGEGDVESCVGAGGGGCAGCNGSGVSGDAAGGGGCGGGCDAGCDAGCGGGGGGGKGSEAGSSDGNGREAGLLGLTLGSDWPGARPSLSRELGSNWR